MRRLILSAGFVCLAFAAFGRSAAAQTFPYDHIHLNAPDPAAAANWYEKYFGGRQITEAPDRLMFGSTRLLFLKKDDAKPSSGSAIDHLGFSFADLDAKMKEFQAAGVKIVTPVRDVQGLFKLGFIEDPWGTRIELVEDPDNLGLHHVTLRVKDPNASLTWYVRAFGGDRASVYGREGIRYRDLGLFYVFAVKDESATPSEGHVIDRIAWGPIDLDKTVNDLKSMGFDKFSSDSNPRANPQCNFIAGSADEGIRRLFCTQPNQLPHRIVYLVAPDGVKVELVQHLEAAGH